MRWCSRHTTVYVTQGPSRSLNHFLEVIYCAFLSVEESQHLHVISIDYSGVGYRTKTSMSKTASLPADESSGAGATKPWEPGTSSSFILAVLV
jgi:hypothetical protein